MRKNNKVEDWLNKIMENIRKKSSSNVRINSKMINKAQTR